MSLAPYFDAAFKGDLDTLKKVPKSLLNSKHPVHGTTMLYTAARFGHIPCAKWLVSAGANVNECNSAENGSAPLHGAAYGGHPLIVSHLLTHGADAGMENAYGESPLDNARSSEAPASRRDKCIAALEAASTLDAAGGADVDMADGDALDVAGGAGVPWSFDVRGDGKWTEYAAEDSAAIEALYQEVGPAGVSSPVKLSFSKFTYVFDFGSMQQRNTATGKLRNVRRGDAAPGKGSPLKKAKTAAKKPAPAAAPEPAPEPALPPKPAVVGATALTLTVPSKAELGKMTVKALQALARSVGQPEAGPKKALIDRLCVLSTDAGDDEPAPAPAAKKPKKAASAVAAAAPAAAAAADAPAGAGGGDDLGVDELRTADFTLTDISRDCQEFWDLEEKFFGCLQGRNNDYVKNRIAAGQKSLTFILKSAQRVSNPVLEKRFNRRLKKMKEAHPSDTKMTRERAAFHGTAPKNIKSILKTSLLRFKHPLNPCKTQSDDGWFGTNLKGVYVSRYADYTFKYANGLEPLDKAERCKIIMFKCLPGKSKHIPVTKEGMDPTPGYDSHSSPEYLEWYLFNEDQLCPTHVLEVQAKEDTRTAADDGDDD
eukprot:TRINITY_DN13517_c0_g1_i2.p1 TRINITY_DN13517_c0_g1~~TRINITY_DN13517_c0_g1_i2.p1  ORF type:complete len:598 (+),score=186.36 TRINITY_DN13517_c0_g1_i2:109-1902(+)